MSSVRTETETVIKRILPYLRRRGYDPETDIDFETPVDNLERYSKGYVDLLVTCGQATPLFVVEAKRNGKRLTQTDAKQALDYGRVVKAPFVVVTNGQIVQVFNSASGEPLRWNGKLADKVPSREQVQDVVAYLRKRKEATDVPLGAGEASLPFRPSLPLKQLNDLFARCHNAIRRIEKNEEHAFADFSKILFLKLLEEKDDAGGFTLPYSFRFWELADRPPGQADQVKSAIQQMLSQVKTLGYGDVLIEDLYLKKPETFRYIVQELAKVAFTDSEYDVKGTAFEYFVRATLKGKKLGQYFTPRPVVEMMLDLVGREAIVNALRANQEVRVCDPACGTGGFLVYLLKDSLNQLDQLFASRKITRATRDTLALKLMAEVFHGADANEGVASAAKMNMVIAGDGHNNILCENSVLPEAALWPLGTASYDFILTNPPFGTSEADALPVEATKRYPVPSDKGQYLFLQRMVLATKAGGIICTVIDEGLLNTDTGHSLRTWVMQHACLLAVIQLPEVTFKPNKINVRSSVLLLQRYDNVDTDLFNSYPVTFASIDSLGYYGDGELVRGFDFRAVRESLSADLLDSSLGGRRAGQGWAAFEVASTDIAADVHKRWDRKYWEPGIVKRTQELIEAGGMTLANLNTIATKRGRSTVATQYVDEPDGYGVVVKAGSNITRYGQVDLDGADWVEKQIFDDLPAAAKLQAGDVLISSTGQGTLGKTAVWDLDHEAVAESHVTIVRVDPAILDPYYLADYLRAGFGQEQIQRLYTGSTGLIELTEEHVDRIVVSMLGGVADQAVLSAALRDAERSFLDQVGEARGSLDEARSSFIEASSQQAD